MVMMNRIMLTIGILLVLPYAIYAELPPDIARIKSNDKLVVALYKDDIYPLFYHDENGILTGHEIGLARGIASALDVDLEFNREAESFDSVIDIVLEKKADLGISLLSRTPIRVMRVRFTSPYLIIHPILIVDRLLASKSENSRLLENLKNNSTVISEKTGTSYIDMAGSFFPDSQIITEDSWDDVILNIINKDAGFALRDEIGVTNLINEKKDLLVNLKLLVLSDVNDYIGIAVHPDNLHLHHWLNIYLEQQNYPIDSKTLFELYPR